MTSRKRSKARSTSDPVLSVNGWRLFAHPFFLDQLEKLIGAVERERGRAARSCRQGANAKLLAALLKLTFEIIPDDPSRPEYRQGGTLGARRKHWFRAKFGAQRFRLFFRYSSEAKVIVYVWVNDSESLRAYDGKRDAYAVFSSMLDAGAPPDDWGALMRECAGPAAGARLRRAADVREKEGE